MEIYTATLIIQKHLNWQNDKRNLPKVNEEKLKEAINLLTDLLRRFCKSANLFKPDHHITNIVVDPSMHPKNRCESHITNIVVDPDFETL
tara:strand:+ start:221 stop:490 length:270 start_codon:yes stop_codon:yes gene_type:complete